MDYNLLKWIHILSSTILFGTGIGSAFTMVAAHWRRELAAIRYATAYVVLADWLFTTPAIIIQFVTGYMLAQAAGWPLFEGWLLLALILFVLAGAAWLPVVWLQIAMKRMAKDVQAIDMLPPRYWRFFRWWVMLGCVAFPAVVLIFYLMAAKPSWI